MNELSEQEEKEVEEAKKVRDCTCNPELLIIKSLPTVQLSNGRHVSIGPPQGIGWLTTDCWFPCKIHPDVVPHPEGIYGDYGEGYSKCLEESSVCFVCGTNTTGRLPLSRRGKNLYPCNRHFGDAKVYLGI